MTETSSLGSRSLGRVAWQRSCSTFARSWRSDIPVLEIRFMAAQQSCSWCKDKYWSTHIFHDTSKSFFRCCSALLLVTEETISIPNEGWVAFLPDTCQAPKHSCFTRSHYFTVSPSWPTTKTRRMTNVFRSGLNWYCSNIKRFSLCDTE